MTKPKPKPKTKPAPRHYAELAWQQADFENKSEADLKLEATLLLESQLQDLESMISAVELEIGEVQDSLGIAYPDGSMPDSPYSPNTALRHMKALQKSLSVIHAMTADIIFKNIQLMDALKKKSLARKKSHVITSTTTTWQQPKPN